MRPLAVLRRRWRRWLTARVLDSRFRAAAIANPLLRPFANRQARQLHDLVAGFVFSQTLSAALETGLLAVLRSRAALDARSLAAALDLPQDRVERLAQAAASLDLVARDADRYELAPLGAAALAVPGVAEIVAHHRLFYADMADPVRLLRGARQTELSRFWAYVGGAATHGLDAATAAEYSALMAATQAMVAEETLDAVSLAGSRRLLDIGGGEGAFLEAVGRRYRHIELALFDLPAVARRAERRFHAAGLAERAHVFPGSFLEDPLPEGADTASLVRVLYDHDDHVVRALLKRVRECMAPGGRLVVSEPMAGGVHPNRVGDCYFGFYTLAMTSGRPRAPEQYAALLVEAGFGDLRVHPTRQGFVTSVMSASRPG